MFSYLNSPVASSHDVSTHDMTGNNKQFISGLVDNGKITFEVYLAETDGYTITTALGYCKSRMGAGNMDSVYVQWPKTLKQTFTGFVEQIDFTHPVDGPHTAKITIVVSGPVTETHTP